MICPRLSLLSCVEIGDNGADALRCVADAGKVIAEQRADLVEEVRQADAIDALVAVGGQAEGEMERVVEAQVLEWIAKRRSESGRISSVSGHVDEPSLPENMCARSWLSVNENVANL